MKQKKERNSTVLSLEAQIEALRSENERLKQQNLSSCSKHNVRGAGRRPSQKRLDAIGQVKTLLNSGCTDQDIMSQLEISRATFYRYKKNLNN